jgi:hypothetical protein
MTTEKRIKILSEAEVQEFYSPQLLTQACYNYSLMTALTANSHLAQLKEKRLIYLLKKNWSLFVYFYVNKQSSTFGLR